MEQDVFYTAGYTTKNDEAMTSCYKSLQYWLADKRALGYAVSHESYTPVVIPNGVHVIVVVRMTLQESSR